MNFNNLIFGLLFWIVSDLKLVFAADNTVYTGVYVAQNQTILVASSWNENSKCPLSLDRVFSINQCIAVTGSYIQYLESKKNVVLYEYDNHDCTSPVSSATVVTSDSCVTYSTYTITTTKLAISSTTVPTTATSTETALVTPTPDANLTSYSISKAIDELRSVAFDKNYAVNVEFVNFQANDLTDSTFISANILPYVSNCAKYNGNFVKSFINASNSSLDLGLYEDANCKKSKGNVLSVPYSHDLEFEEVKTINIPIGTSGSTEGTFTIYTNKGGSFYINRNTTTNATTDGSLISSSKGLSSNMFVVVSASIIGCLTLLI